MAKAGAAFAAFFLMALLSACLGGSGDSGLSIGDPPVKAAPAKGGKAASKSSGIFFGNYFKVQSSGSYKLLMSSCLRCIDKRQQCGGTHVKTIFESRSSPRRCDGWLREGFMQIQFQERKLPTGATVTIWPKHSHLNWGGYGQSAAFAVHSTARPINENRGFSITLTQNQGLGGGYPLTVMSRNSNHVKKNSLSVEVEYGPSSGGNIIIEEQLRLLKERAVPAPRLTCRQCAPWIYYR